MATLKWIAANLPFMGDGVTTQFSLDLLSDVWGPGASYVNLDAKTLRDVNAVFVPAGVGYTASISGSIVTVTFSSPPPANSPTSSEASVYLLYS